MYISKGMVARPSTEELLFVTRCGVEFRLTGIEADLWLDGRFSFAYEKTEEQHWDACRWRMLSIAHDSLQKPS